MVRPFKLRVVEDVPRCVYFKPQGVGISQVENLLLTLDEYEALRLKEYENLQEKDACEKMEVSQPTFNRLYTKAKKKLVRAIVEGLAIKIEGGNYKMPNLDGRGSRFNDCGRFARRGRGFGNRNRGFNGVGVGGRCVCPKCDFSENHNRGEPCYLKKCPKCGENLVREV
jgi:predicted DNA-binding protein (UPF0251 family)